MCNHLRIDVQAFCMFQRRLMNKRLIDISLEFGRDTAAISRITKAFMVQMHNKWAHLLTWEALERRAQPAGMEQYRAAVRDVGCPSVSTLPLPLLNCIRQ